MSSSVFENLPQDIILKITYLVKKEYSNFVKLYKIRRQTNVIIKLQIC